MNADPVRPRKRIKPVSRADNHQKLRSLKCFKEVHSRLIEQGHPINPTARFIQEERNEATDIDFKSLTNLLHIYRDSIPAAQRMRPLSLNLEKAAQEVAQGMDELEELQSLYKIQMERIQIDFQTEKNIKKLLPTMSQEIRTAREILSAASQLKMDLGLNERHLGTVDVETTLLKDVAEKYADSPAVSKVLESGDSRRKVLGLAERLLAIADRAERHPEVADQLDALTPNDPDATSDEAE